MPKLIFIGTRLEIEGVCELTRYGQAFDVSEELVKDVLAKGTSLRAEDFAKIGHTTEELAKYGAVWMHDQAPAEFLARKAKALAMAQTGEMPVTVRAMPPLISAE